MKSKSELKRECERVNRLLKEEAQGLRLGTKYGFDRLNKSRGDLATFSYWAQLEFREYVRRQLERQTCTATVLINGGARLLGISSVTAKRYLAALRVQGGPFSGLGDIVVLNPHYVPLEEDDYWLDDPEPIEQKTDQEETS